MIIQTKSISLIGLNGTSISIEIDSYQGLPGISIIGLASKTVSESKDRIVSALRNSEINLASKKIIINLSPADLTKSGSHFDLAIAAGIIQHFYKNLNINFNNSVFIGELALDGRITPVKSVLPLTLAAKQLGYKSVYFPKENLSQLKLIKSLNLFPVQHIKELLRPQKIKPYQEMEPSISINSKTFFSCQIEGQPLAKKAIEIAAAGKHNLLLIGAPGVGKTMLAQTYCQLLPPLTSTEQLEITSIYSINKTNQKIVTTRPFRSPHHHITQSGLIGGGHPIHPGEITLAHKGILFLDELPEFSKKCLESLRQPLEDKKIEIARSKQTAIFPADFQLIATANPCPCGYFFSKNKRCSCSFLQREKYFKKISGPILDRIDMIVVVDDFIVHKSTKKHCFNLKKINEAFNQRNLQINFTSKAEKLLEKSYSIQKLSRRVLNQLQKLSKTIALLDESDKIKASHVSMALQFKPELNLNY